MATCHRCAGSGEIAVSTVYPMSYRGPGPVPDTARGVVGVSCDECGGNGGFCDSCGEPDRELVNANAGALYPMPAHEICPECLDAAIDPQQERLAEEIA